MDTHPGEIWKPVPRWEKLYEVSSLGRIRFKARTTAYNSPLGTPIERKEPERIVEPTVEPSGALSVRLHRQASGRRPKLAKIRVARTVLSVFDKTAPPTAIPIYADGNPANCRADNLSWGKREYYDMSKRRPKPKGVSDLVEKALVLFRTESNMVQVAKAAGLHRSTLHLWEREGVQSVDSMNRALRSVGYKLEIVKDST